MLIEAARKERRCNQVEEKEEEMDHIYTLYRFRDRDQLTSSEEKKFKYCKEEEERMEENLHNE